MVVEVAGSARMLSEMTCHMLAHLTAQETGSRVRLCIVDVQASFDYRRWWFEVRHLMSSTGRPMSAGEEAQLLLGVVIRKCDSDLDVLSQLRAYELEVASSQPGAHHVLFVSGLSNLFWSSRQFRKGAEAVPYGVTVGPQKKRADVLGALMSQLRRLSEQAVTVLVGKLVLFPNRAIGDDYFGRHWLACVNVRLQVDEVRMTRSLVGRSGLASRGTLVEVEHPELSVGFALGEAGCLFG